MPVKTDDAEFRAMSDDDLDREWREIEEVTDSGHGFFTVRALYILRERIRRLEAAVKAERTGNR